MATKSKNNSNENNSQNKFSKKTLALMILSLFFFIFGIIGSSAFFSIKNNTIDFSENNSITMNVINSEAIRYAKNLNRFYIYFKNFDSKEAYSSLKKIEEKLSKNSEINNLQNPNFQEDVENKNLNSSNDNYLETEKTEDDIYYEMLFEKAPESYYKNLNYDNLKQEELLNIYKNLKEVYENYELVKNYLKQEKGFQYKIENKNSKTIYTNNENFDNEEFYAKFSLDCDLFTSEKFNGEYLASSFEQNNLEGHIIIPKSIASDTNLQSGISLYIKVVEVSASICNYMQYIIPVIFIFALAPIIYIIAKQRRCAINIINTTCKKITKIPLILKITLFVISLSAFLNMFDTYDFEYYDCIMGIISNGDYQNVYSIIISLIIKIIISTIFILGIVYFIHLIAKPSSFKDEYEIKFVYNIVNNTKYILQSKNYGLFVLFLFLISGTLFSLFLFFLVLIYARAHIFHIIIIFAIEFIGIITVQKIINLILAYCKLTVYTENIANDNINEINEDSKAFSQPFENLKKINNNVASKIEEMTKNERLKTELITNVSHDLRTPLTSIINYIDLLKAEKTENNSTNEYIKIIDEKSQRLKKLIDDLFDASKLSSKQFNLNVSKADIVSLLKQTIGEFNQKIEDSNINFVMEIPNKPIFLNIDGQQIWRVFDNLFNNILKYSAKNSRAYISLEETDNQVKIIMKNISQTSLNFNSEELFERFKRGDKSRTTEGSGLGLSIAKSIIELHKGNIFIKTDGDLFKVIVVLNKTAN